MPGPLQVQGVQCCDANNCSKPIIGLWRYLCFSDGTCPYTFYTCNNDPYAVSLWNSLTPLSENELGPVKFLYYRGEPTVSGLPPFDFDGCWSLRFIQGVPNGPGCTNTSGGLVSDVRNCCPDNPLPPGSVDDGLDPNLCLAEPVRFSNYDEWDALIGTLELDGNSDDALEGEGNLLYGTCNDACENDDPEGGGGGEPVLDCDLLGLTMRMEYRAFTAKHSGAVNFTETNSGQNTDIVGNCGYVNVCQFGPEPDDYTITGRCDEDNLEQFSNFCYTETTGSQSVGIGGYASSNGGFFTNPANPGVQSEFIVTNVDLLGACEGRCTTIPFLQQQTPRLLNIGYPSDARRTQITADSGLMFRETCEADDEKVTATYTNQHTGPHRLSKVVCSLEGLLAAHFVPPYPLQSVGHPYNTYNITVDSDCEEQGFVLGIDSYKLYHKAQRTHNFNPSVAWNGYWVGRSEYNYETGLTKRSCSFIVDDVNDPDNGREIAFDELAHVSETVDPVTGFRKPPDFLVREFNPALQEELEGPLDPFSNATVENTSSAGCLKFAVAFGCDYEIDTDPANDANLPADPPDRLVYNFDEPNGSYFPSAGFTYSTDFLPAQAFVSGYSNRHNIEDFPVEFPCFGDGECKPPGTHYYSRFRMTYQSQNGDGFFI